MAAETTLDEWAVQIPDAKGKWEKVIFPFMRTVVETGIPQMKWRTTNTSFTTTEAVKSLLTTGRRPAHEVFELTMTTLPGYAVLVDAQDYGENLLVSWKIVFSRHELPLWRNFAHYKGWTDAAKLTPSGQQDFAALKTITQDALKKAVRNFGNELDEDFSGEDERSRGIDTIEPIDAPEGRERGGGNEIAEHVAKEKERSLGIETIEF